MIPKKQSFSIDIEWSNMSNALDISWYTFIDDSFFI